MRNRVISIAALGAVLLLRILISDAEALPSAKGLPQAPAPYSLKIGCGWDYPCPPEPGYGRNLRSWPRRQPQEQVYIHNNYGTVTIQVDGQQRKGVNGDPLPAPCCEPPPRAADWPPPCPPAGCNVAIQPDYWPSCGTPPCIEERPKEDCGVKCWWKRIRSGYCGHGCWAYREQARLEAEEKQEQEELKREKKAEREAEREARRESWEHGPPYPGYYYRPPEPPSYERSWDRETGPRYETPKIDERTPISRFQGPKYP
jgi:hypothetical protein